MKPGAVLFALALLACGSGRGGGNGPDASARAACAQFATLARSLRDGMVTQTEVLTELQAIDRRASKSKVAAVRDAAHGALAAMTADPDADLEPAFAQLTAACEPGGVPSRMAPAGDSAPTASAAEGTPLEVPSDPNAQYFVLEQGGTRTRPTIVTKRVAAGGATYSRREFDCAAEKFRYLGDGDTRAAMDASPPDTTSRPMVGGSIAADIGKAACTKGR